MQICSWSLCYKWKRFHTNMLIHKVLQMKKVPCKHAPPCYKWKRCHTNMLIHKVLQMKKVPRKYAPSYYKGMERNLWKRFRVVLSKDGRCSMVEEHVCMEPFSFVVPHGGADLHGTFFISSMKEEQICMEPFSFVVPHGGADLHGTFFICSMKEEQICMEPFSFVVPYGGACLHGTFFICSTSWRSMFARNLFHL